MEKSNLKMSYVENVIHSYYEVNHENSIKIYTNNAKLDIGKESKSNNIIKEYYKEEFQIQFLDKIHENKSLHHIHDMNLEYYPECIITWIHLLDIIQKEHTTISNHYNLKYPKVKHVHEYLHYHNHVLRDLNVHDNLFKMINKCETTLGKYFLKEQLIHPEIDPCQMESRYKITEKIINEKLVNVYKSFLTNKEVQYFSHIYKKVILDNSFHDQNDFIRFYDFMIYISSKVDIIKEDELNEIIHFYKKNVNVYTENRAYIFRDTCDTFKSIRKEYMKIQIEINQYFENIKKVMEEEGTYIFKLKKDNNQKKNNNVIKY